MLEAPKCSLCDDPLLTDLSTPVCGHVFHSHWYSLLSLHCHLVSSFFCPVCLTPSRQGDIILLRISLGSELEQTQTELKCADAAVQAMELTNASLNTQISDYSAELLQLQTELVALQQDLATACLLRNNQEILLNELSSLKESAKAAFRLPAVQRAKEIRETCCPAEQVERLFTQVVALSSLHESEQARQGQLHSEIRQLENCLRCERWKARRLEEDNPPQA